MRKIAKEYVNAMILENAQIKNKRRQQKIMVAKIVILQNMKILIGKLMQDQYHYNRIISM